MIPPNELKDLHATFWSNFSNQFDLKTNEGCGKYTEAWVIYARNHGWSKVGHLKKSGSQTQYNGHANDAFLYNEPDPTLLRAVDIIGNAESTDPNRPPSIGWIIDEPRYTINDWLAEPNTNPNPNMVPWVGYNEQGFQRLKNTLAHDYARRPQGADFDVSVWAARVFHSQYFGPNGIPLGEEAALHKHKPEWCHELGISVDDYYGN